MYAKTVTEKIIHYQALGFTGEETRNALQEDFGIHPCLNTVYKHRRSPVGVEMLCELIRHQERDILKASSTEQREIAMKYRDKLIEKLMDRLFPRLTQIDSHHTQEDVTVEVKRLEVVQLLDTYGGAVEQAIQRNIQSSTKDRAR